MLGFAVCADGFQPTAAAQPDHSPQEDTEYCRFSGAEARPRDSGTEGKARSSRDVTENTPRPVLRVGFYPIQRGKEDGIAEMNKSWFLESMNQWHWEGGTDSSKTHIHTHTRKIMNDHVTLQKPSTGFSIPLNNPGVEQGEETQPQRQSYLQSPLLETRVCGEVELGALNHAGAIPPKAGETLGCTANGDARLPSSSAWSRRTGPPWGN